MPVQSRASALAESVFSTFVGLLIAMAMMQVIAWAYSIPLEVRDNFILTFWMTVLSVLRQYIIRRMWEPLWTRLHRLRHRGILQLKVRGKR